MSFMGSYEFLPHTADEKFVVTANSLEDGFSTSVEAFFEILLGDAVFVSKIGEDLLLNNRRWPMADSISELEPSDGAHLFPCLDFRDFS